MSLNIHNDSICFLADLITAEAEESYRRLPFSSPSSCCTVLQILLLVQMLHSCNEGWKKSQTKACTLEKVTPPPLPPHQKEQTLYFIFFGAVHFSSFRFGQLYFYLFPYITNINKHYEKNFSLSASLFGNPTDDPETDRQTDKYQHPFQWPSPLY